LLSDGNLELTTEESKRLESLEVPVYGGQRKPHDLVIVRSTGAILTLFAARSTCPAKDFITLLLDLKPVFEGDEMKSGFSLYPVKIH
jgi:hypothetical protein